MKVSCKSFIQFLLKYFLILSISFEIQKKGIIQFISFNTFPPFKIFFNIHIQFFRNSFHHGFLFSLFGLDWKVGGKRFIQTIESLCTAKNKLVIFIKLFLALF